MSLPSGRIVLASSSVSSTAAGRIGVYLARSSVSRAAAGRIGVYYLIIREFEELRGGQSLGLFCLIPRKFLVIGGQSFVVFYLLLDFVVVTLVLHHGGK